MKSKGAEPGVSPSTPAPLPSPPPLGVLPDPDQKAVTASIMKPLKRPPFRISVAMNPSYF